MAMKSESFGVDGVGYDTSNSDGDRDRAVKFDKPAVFKDHVSGHSDCTFPASLSAVFVFVTLVFADMI